MKKIYIAMMALAAISLTSCVQTEQPFDDIKLGENELSFVMSGVSTKSATDSPMAITGVSIPMGATPNGEALFLDETIEELNPSPATKGAPAYTVNVGTLYPEMAVHADGGNFGDGEVTFSVMDQYINKDESLGMGWRYNHNYAERPWPESDDEKVDFYLRMPASQTGVTIPQNAYNEGAFTFDFESPTTGETQQDILFSYTSLSKTEHDGFLENGAPVLMYHALTGVKFRSGHANSNSTNTIITQVKITGLKKAGTCTVDLSADDVIVWNASSTTGTFTQKFINPTYTYTTDDEGNITVTSGDGTVSYSSSDNKFGNSWYSAAADHNLNNADGELTFWFIPQMLNENVKLEVTFCVKTPDTSGDQGAGYITHTIDFGKLTRTQTKDDAGNITYGPYANWQAGQLRTYTLRPSDVDVEIFDEMSGLEKDNLHVTNTGNVDEFVRMMLIGNWYDSDGNILVGYKYSGTTDPNYIADKANNPNTDVNEMVAPWFREDPDFAQYFDNTFKNGFPNGNNPWVFGTGSYFYYPDIIGPGDKLSGTDALFQSYILPESAIPTIWLQTAGSATRTEAQGVHLVMEVVVQAISTINPESPTGDAFADWKAAWSYVTNKEIKEKTNPNKQTSGSGN